MLRTLLRSILLLVFALLALLGGSWYLHVYIPEMRLRTEISRIISGGDARFRTAVERVEQREPHWRIGDILDAYADEGADAPKNSRAQVEKVLELLPDDWDRRPHSARGAGSIPPARVVQRGKLLLALNQLEPRQAVPADLAGLLESELASVEPALRAARSLAGMGSGHARITLAPNPLATRLDFTPQTQLVVELLRFDAVLRKARGDIDGALESVSAMFAAARAIGDEPFLISQLVRSAHLATCLQTLEQVVAHARPSDTSIAMLMNDLRLEAAHPRLQVSLRGERGLMTELCERLASGELQLARVELESLPDAAKLRPEQMSCWFWHNGALLLERMSEDVEIAGRPLFEQAVYWSLSGNRAAGLNATEAARWANSFFMVHGATSITHFEAARHLQARLNAAIVAGACLRYANRCGNWPPTLEALVPADLDAVPLDPYNGQPLRLALQSDGLTVYALGRDMSDDGGRLHPDRSQGAPGYDIGFCLFLAGNAEAR